VVPFLLLTPRQSGKYELMTAQTDCRSQVIRTGGTSHRQDGTVLRSPGKDDRWLALTADLGLHAAVQVACAQAQHPLA
jgi:hypothetical protein